jgi:hypothetical protein
VVLFGVFPHDLDRTLTIYNFLSFPSWGFPFAKPRFTVEDGELRNRLPRPPSPEAIAAHGSVFELPLLELDAGFWPFEWRWRPLYASWLVRAVVSRLPPPRTLPVAVSPAAREAVNGALLEAFLRSAEAAGSRALLVYFPARAELSDEPGYALELAGTREWLAARGLRYFDLTPSVTALPPERRYLAIGRHLTPEANARVAAALVDAVRERLRAAR